MSFADFLRNKAGFIGSSGRTKEEILQAEEELCIRFAADYHEYLERIGLASVEGHELTGLTNDIRLDVVAVTKEYRALYGPDIVSWYVVEDIGIDGVVIWQDEKGTIYQTSFTVEPVKIAESLEEYLRD